MARPITLGSDKVREVDLIPPDQLSSSNAPVKAIVDTTERLAKLSTALNLPIDKLPEEGVIELRALLSEFPDVFAPDNSELGCTDLVKHSINTGSHSPLKQKPYPPVPLSSVERSR